MASEYVVVYAGLSDTIGANTAQDDVRVSIPDDIYATWAYTKSDGSTGHSPVAIAYYQWADRPGALFIDIVGFGNYKLFFAPHLRNLAYPGSWPGFSPVMDVPSSFTVHIANDILYGATASFTGLNFAFCAAPVGGTVFGFTSFLGAAAVQSRGRSFGQVIG